MTVRRAKTSFEWDGNLYHLTSYGYYRSTLGKKFLHRAVWEKTHGLIPKGFVIHHKDGNPLNNNLPNLELMEWGHHNAMHHKAISQIIEIDGLKLTPAEWQKRNKLPKDRITARIRRGWEPKLAVTAKPYRIRISKSKKP